MVGAYVLGAAVAAAVVIALLLRWKNGRFSAAADTGRDGDALVMTADDLGTEPGERATLVQFSSSFCAPCRATRVVLGQVVDLVPGVVTVEIDAESSLDLVRRHQILRTPTVLVLDADGRVVGRASGAPTRDQVLVALEAAIPG